MNNMVSTRLSLDRLEPRLLLARSTNVLFDFEFEGHLSDWDESLSEVYFANDQYFAWANNSTKDRGRFVVVDSTSNESSPVRNLPTQRPDQVVALDEVLYLFYARDRDDIGNFIDPEVGGQEVWAVDGHKARLVSEISDHGFAGSQFRTESLRSNSRPFYGFAFGDKIYFPADDQLSSSSAFVSTRFNNYSIWQTDGTTEGTDPTSLTIEIDEGLVVADKLYFIAHDEEGSSLHVASDAIESATELGRFQFADYDRKTQRLFAYDDRLYFHATQDGSDLKLWSTDGVSEPIMSALPNQDRRDAMPGEILYDSMELTISARHIQDSVELEKCPPLLDDCGPVERFLVDLWVWQDGDTAPRFLTQVEDAPETPLGLDDDSPQNMWAQVIGNQVFFRMLSSREAGNNMRFLMHSIPIPEGDEGHVPGDLNCDGSVGFDDFLVLSENFGKAVDAVWTDGDFNGDGKVDFADFLALSHNFVSIV